MRMHAKKLQLGLKGKFLIAYFLVIAVLMLLIGSIYYKTTSDELYNIVTSDLVSLLQKNNEIIDQRLTIVSEYANGLMVDGDMAACLEQYRVAQSEYEIFKLDRPISQLLNQYFLYANEVFSMNIMTKRMSYGPIKSSNIIPAQTFANSSLYKAAIQGNGKTVWVPTYHFFDEFSQDYILSQNASYQNVFSAVKLIQTFDDDYAILVINFLDEVYSGVFSTLDLDFGGRYFVISPEGTVVSHTNPAYLGATLNYGWLDRTFETGCGFETIQISQKDYIMCYDVSKTTGWMAGFLIERNVMMKGFIQNIINNLLVILIILLILPLFVVMAISSGILRPLDTLRNGMKSSGQGNFDLAVAETGMTEIRHLINRFNRMNSHIQRLIRENYEMVISKKEAELNAYNLQLNPHFILNSLNIINLELIKNEHDDLSTMVVELSQMMDYTLNTTESLVPFEKDWVHTHNYLKVMSRRYKGKFDFAFDIDPALFSHTVPKFFLQPLVENCIFHGFLNIDYRGQIMVRAYIKDGLRVFSVEDNGTGIDVQTMQRIFEDHAKSIGIQNVRHRIHCIYGEQYDLQITSRPFELTTVMVRLP